MKLINNIASIVLLFLSAANAASAQHTARSADNSALRYWSAFSEVQDVAITGQQATELNAIFDGTAPYDDSRYKDLLDKNTLALETMARGTSLQNCDWGLDYALGPNMPVDYAKKGLVLGRLNELYTFHMLKTGNVGGAVHSLTAGLRFSHDMANGGSLLATLVAKSLLAGHLRALEDVLQVERLSVAQRLQLQTAVADLGDGLDWSMALKRDLEALRQDYVVDSQTAAILDRIITAYLAAMNDGSKLPAVKQVLKDAPQKLVDVIPNVKSLRQVLEEKQTLANSLQHARALLR